MGDEMWLPPVEAPMASGEEEPAAPDATILIGDDVLQDRVTTVSSMFDPYFTRTG